MLCTDEDVLMDFYLYSHWHLQNASDFEKLSTAWNFVRVQLKEPRAAQYCLSPHLEVKAGSSSRLSQSDSHAWIVQS